MRECVALDGSEKYFEFPFHILILCKIGLPTPAKIIKILPTRIIGVVSKQLL
jgi:hypothetical protein